MKRPLKSDKGLFEGNSRENVLFGREKQKEADGVSG